MNINWDCTILFNNTQINILPDDYNKYTIIYDDYKFKINNNVIIKIFHNDNSIDFINNFNINCHTCQNTETIMLKGYYIIEDDKRKIYDLQDNFIYNIDISNSAFIESDIDNDLDKYYIQYCEDCKCIKNNNLLKIN